MFQRAAPRRRRRARRRRGTGGAPLDPFAGAASRPPPAPGRGRGLRLPRPRPAPLTIPGWSRARTAPPRAESAFGPPRLARELRAQLLDGDVGPAAEDLRTMDQGMSRHRRAARRRGSVRRRSASIGSVWLSPPRAIACSASGESPGSAPGPGGSISCRSPSRPPIRGAGQATWATAVQAARRRGANPPAISTRRRLVAPDSPPGQRRLRVVRSSASSVRRVSSPTSAGARPRAASACEGRRGFLRRGPERPRRSQDLVPPDAGPAGPRGRVTVAISAASSAPGRSSASNAGRIDPASAPDRTRR